MPKFALVVILLAVASQAYGSAVLENADIRTVGVPSAAHARMDLRSGLALKGQEIRDLWFVKQGKPQRAACNLQCTNSCHGDYMSCLSAGTPHEYCCNEWIVCMCTNSCCTFCPDQCP